MGETRTKKTGKKPKPCGSSSALKNSIGVLDEVVAKSSNNRPPSTISFEQAPPRPYDTSLIQIEKTANKGYGVFAARKIPAGTLCLVEAPLIRLTPSEDVGTDEQRQLYIQHYYEALPTHSQKDYRHLCDTKKADFTRRMSIFYSNCYDMKHYGGGACIGEIASRINHSCTPNVVFSFAKTLPDSLFTGDKKDVPRPSQASVGFMVFHAIKDISKGKELVSNYQSIWRLTPERQAEMSIHYRFRCDCMACEQDSPGQDGDRRRRNMIKYRNIVLTADKELTMSRKEWLMRQGQMSESERHEDLYSWLRSQVVQDKVSTALEKLTALAQLLPKEGIHGGHDLANIYKDLAKWSMRADDEVAANKWLQSELEICTKSFGSWSERVKEIHERQPGWWLIGLDKE
ncbi:hypothetical protein LTR64_001494 [Lithohypha guttulata]|uniref:uncharacterized protein n=1 Tax=Lithohypha guttulata TaxID=1690604 RepID=UPI002DE11FCC|nr:hypothetical protein LTR51_003688 [Lithohypha guttulata]